MKTTKDKTPKKWRKTPKKWRNNKTMCFFKWLRRDGQIVFEENKNHLPAEACYHLYKQSYSRDYYQQRKAKKAGKEKVR